MTLFEFLQKSNEFYTGIIEEVNISSLHDSCQEIWPGPYHIAVQNNRIGIQLADDSIETVIWALQNF